MKRATKRRTNCNKLTAKISSRLQIMQTPPREEEEVPKFKVSSRKIKRTERDRDEVAITL